MHIGVIGAGLVGLTTAHALQREGFQVTVLESQGQPGMQASYANGAQLSYSYTDPMANPQMLRVLPSILLGKSAGIRIRHKIDAKYLSWGARFLWNCLPHQSRRNADELMNLAVRSSELMAQYHANHELAYYRSEAGKLVLLDSSPNSQIRYNIARRKAVGISIELLDRAQTVELAPELSTWTSRFKHALYSPHDGVADANEFTNSLARHLCREGVAFQYDQQVSSLLSLDSGLVVVTQESQAAFDAVVVCAGNGAGPLLENTSETPALQPITGYSLSLPIGPASPRLSITALAERVVIARLASTIRVAGFADLNPKPATQLQRIDELHQAAERLAPDAACYATTDKRAWIGHRPATPGGPPRVGKTATPGLYQNIGHGSLGWTLAAATAELVVDAVVRDQ